MTGESRELLCRNNLQIINDESELPSVKDSSDYDAQGIKPIFVADEDASNRTLNPLPSPPTPAGTQKLITVVAKTQDVSDADTDKKYCYLTINWKTNTGSSYSERFILDNPNHDDLNRRSTNYFYYMLNVRSYGNFSSDYLNYAYIGNTSTAGWACEYIKITEMNSSGASRSNTLYFNTGVDCPSPQTSSIIYGNSTIWLGF